MSHDHDGGPHDHDLGLSHDLPRLLSRRRMLLLVDNCEHVVDAAAVLIDDILSRCPGITVLATSREALAIPDEVQVAVGPLETPPEDIPAGEVLSYPAAELFADRARAGKPSASTAASIRRADSASSGAPCRRPSQSSSIAIDRLSASSTSSATSGVVSSGSGSHGPTYDSRRRALVRIRLSASRVVIRTR